MLSDFTNTSTSAPAPRCNTSTRWAVVPLTGRDEPHRRGAHSMLQMLHGVTKKFSFINLMRYHAIPLQKSCCAGAACRNPALRRLRASHRVRLIKWSWHLGPGPRRRGRVRASINALPTPRRRGMPGRDTTHGNPRRFAVQEPDEPLFCTPHPALCTSRPHCPSPRASPTSSSCMAVPMSARVAAGTERWSTVPTTLTVVSPPETALKTWSSEKQRRRKKQGRGPFFLRAKKTGTGTVFSAA